MENKLIKFISFVFGVFLFITPSFVGAENLYKFNIDSSYNPDNTQQYQVSSELKSSFSRLDFYVDSDFLSSKSWTERNEMNNTFSSLSNEFETKIYPQLTEVFGTEKHSTKVGIEKIAVLFYPMKEGVRGYIRNIDAYDKIINPSSNQMEVIYLNSNYIDSPLLPEILAHEFTHLIELNQKELKNGIAEDIWLNEARAEYAVTLLGYNNDGEEGYLDKRIKDFILKPTDSLTEWSNTNYDYGAVSMFVHYLVEQYGLNILKDSLNYSKIGIDSINEALKNNNYKETFEDVYSNWSVAVYLNDCSVSSKYCYVNGKLKNLKVLPVNTFMPFFQESSVSVNQSIKNWSSNWQKFVGVNGNFKLEIKSPEKCKFKAFYITKDQYEKSLVKIINFNPGETKEVIVPNISENISPIVFIFSIEGSELEKTTPNLFFVYSTTASVTLEENFSEPEVNLPIETDKPLNQMTREELLRVLLKVIIYLLSQGKTINY
ncbi:MAG: hypothetical protein WAW15_03230 [Minisyncoccales bacterium]